MWLVYTWNRHQKEENCGWCMLIGINGAKKKDWLVKINGTNNEEKTSTTTLKVIGLCS
jgi:hypothetical protein